MELLAGVGCRQRLAAASPQQWERCSKQRLELALPFLCSGPLWRQSHTDGTETPLSALSTQAAPVQTPTSTFPPQGHAATSCKPAPCPAASSPQLQHAQAPGANLLWDEQPRSILLYAAAASRLPRHERPRQKGAFVKAGCEGGQRETALAQEGRRCCELGRTAPGSNSTPW